MSNEKKPTPFQLLSKVSGIPEAEIRQIADKIVENARKAEACPRHLFEPTPQHPAHILDKRRTFYRCQICGADLQMHEIRQYIAGYQAAGGHPDDIWPKWKTFTPGAVDLVKQFENALTPIK